MNTKDKISKEILKKLANSVTIITCQKDEKRDATTVAWITRVSNNPPLIMVSISPRRYIHDLIVQAKEFNIAFSPTVVGAKEPTRQKIDKLTNASSFFGSGKPAGAEYHDLQTVA